MGLCFGFTSLFLSLVVSLVQYSESRPPNFACKRKVTIGDAIMGGNFQSSTNINIILGSPESIACGSTLQTGSYQRDWRCFPWSQLWARVPSLQRKNVEAHSSSRDRQLDGMESVAGRNTVASRNPRKLFGANERPRDLRDFQLAGHCQCQDRLGARLVRCFRE